ncbi:AzlD domain-containing protein [Nocardioides caldifontis]|uniref:AzlD domain-containing protein n=1 Tax=Nocardioides caldifontis TaxID=2588938 RepID=UPI0011E0469F|nr:AzlD domain-containing protein [Nocardioides caldifontis]
MTLWILIGACALMTAVVKGIGPWALGGRELPGWFPSLVTAMVPALLAGLVVTAALADGRRIEIGADTAGVAAALVVAWRGGSMLAVVLVAVAVTAGLRLVL